MNLETWVNIILSVFSFLLALISIIFVWLTLKQNNKMLENSTRPYIVVSYETTATTGPTFRYLLVKNYGQSSGTILNIKSNLVPTDIFDNDFNSHIGTTLAPSQSVLYYYGMPLEGSIDSIIIDITYKSTSKTYSESYSINMVNGKKAMRIPNEDSIVCCLQEIIERLI